MVITLFVATLAYPTRGVRAKALGKRTSSSAEDCGMRAMLQIWRERRVNQRQARSSSLLEGLTMTDPDVSKIQRCRNLILGKASPLHP